MIMTENKRFWILNTLTEYSGIKDKDKLLTFNEVVDLLNKFYEENKGLKLQLDAFKDKICELGVSDAKRYDKRFHRAISNDNTVRLIDHERNNDLISIGFKKHSDAADCSDALQYLCNLMNGLAEENEQLRKENDMFSCELSVSANKEISRNCRIAELKEENKQLKEYKQSVNDALRSWSQKNVTAKQLEVVLAIMEELNVIGDVE